MTNSAYSMPVQRGSARLSVVASLGLLASLLWLAAVLVAPSDPAVWHLGGVATIPVELAVLVVALAAIPALRRSTVLRWMIAALAIVFVALKLADLAVRMSLGRPLNPFLDSHLAGSVVDLAVGTVGRWQAALAGLAIVAGLVIVGLLTAASVRALQRALGHRPARRWVAALSLCAIAAFTAQRVLPATLGAVAVVDDAASRLVAQQVARVSAALDDLAAFRVLEATDPLAARPAAGLFAGLGGADVALVFIESYGRSAVEDPRYAPRTVDALDDATAALRRAGLASASGWLTSPTMGGQSWLAHATLMSGLWIDDQLRHDLLVTGRRTTLPGLFEAAGYRTVTVAPAITRAWPEERFYGFDRTLPAAALGYAGRPYNWVTMPDQYTLAAFERLAPRAAESPRFAVVTLISSHAPWTPIPPVLDDWAAIGDGRVFSTWADAGDPPEVVWRDPDRVRAQYLLSIDYVLRVLTSYAEGFADDHTLLVVVGDHQPAPIITAGEGGRDVPMHVISGNPALLAPFLDWGFASGMVPRPNGPVHRMDAFRDWFVDAFPAPRAGRSVRL